ncbi:Dihydroorotase [Rhodovastum atsumiense]|uniref:Dihydroorotase n=1 Tax=Rhodovastum atsumiense TaxID=504468 RepID=A0A5M6IRI3_9PROT|nr:dihydroorotase [Rhodovastum atsumiense]KAA5610896.1 dihydroorotase [Rhodovastum atsumiense]CAH2601539.1 Dihydroorotase [Rhodovastum atsumiense]
MSAHYDLIIRGGTCVLPWGMEQTDVGVRDGRIAGLGIGTDATAAETIDATGLHVLPGLIDPHVHLRDAGDAANAAVESMPTGTKAAVLGGVVAVFDMPNTRPALVDATTLAVKQDYAERVAWCDIGFYVGATKTNVPALAELETGRGVCAVKVFAGSSTGDLLVDDDAGIERVMRSGRRRIAYHSEDEARLQTRKPQFKSGDPYAFHMEWRDEECAFLGTRRLMALARRTGRAAHILHVSTAQELEYLKDFRDVATCEVLVNHLTQVAPDCYERLGGYGVMNPPIRGERHRAAAWAALRDGTVDCIGSDHAPHPRAAKERPWPECHSGLTGVQTLVPVMLDHVNAGRLSLPRLVDLMCAGPARVYGIVGKGRLAAGYDADFTLVDMRRTRRIEESWIASPCGWTPFAGMQVTGWPVATIIRGMPVMREDEVLGAPRGRLVRFAG